MKKKDLGQFYTKNSKYIIGNLLEYIPIDSVVVDPFVGEWDLLNLVNNEKIGYDIDPKNEYTIKKDTLLNPPNYEGKYIITNPPYLARNKNKDKSLYDKYNLNDLYKISLKTIIGCEGGIIIIPLNFFSDERTILKNEFLSKYQVKKLNIFEETVFSDTTYTVCSFFFYKKDNIEQEIDIEFFPSKKNVSFKIEKKFDYKIGGDFLNNIKKYKLDVKRLVENNKNKPNSNLYLRCTDSGTIGGRISLSISDKYFYAKESDRTFATIILPEPYDNLNIEKQQKICDYFNEIINEKREKYNSLFLTNYRNSSNGQARKRISLKLSYNIISYILMEKL